MRIRYKEYPEYPIATAISKNLCVFDALLGGFFFCWGLVSVIDGDILFSLLFAALVILDVVILSLHDRIIGFVIKRTKSQSEIAKELYISEEDLYKAKAYQRKAKYFLSLGVHCKEFKQEAEKAGMSPKGYKIYCKRCIEDYDEKFRRYNLSHKGRIEY